MSNQTNRTKPINPLSRAGKRKIRNKTEKLQFQDNIDRIVHIYKLPKQNNSIVKLNPHAPEKPCTQTIKSQLFQRHYPRTYTVENIAQTEYLRTQEEKDIQDNFLLLTGGSITTATTTQTEESLRGLHSRLENAPNMARNLVDITLPTELLGQLIKPAPDAPEPTLVPITALPISSVEFLKEQLLANVGSKDSRELMTSKGYTDQFKEDKGEFHNAIPWHRAVDAATFQAAIDKRIKIAPSAVNRRNFRHPRSRYIGRELFKAFCRASGIPKERQKFDEDMHLDCINTWIVNRVTKKTVKNLVNIDGRGDPDQPINKVDLFLKSQKILKTEKFGGKAVPGQTIISMHADLLKSTGPMARYLQRKVASFLPKKHIIFTEMSPDELETWALENFDFTKDSLELDFSAFDQSQNAEFLWFEIFLMQHFSYPQDSIDLYVKVKLNTTLYLGVLKIMRLTGEGPTFFFNSICGKAATCLKYDVTPDDPCGVSGDDTALNGNFIVSEHYEKNIEPYLALKSKEIWSKHPTLCGWVLTEHGIYKNIQKLFTSMFVQAEADNLDNSLPSYAIEHHYFYSKAELLIDYLSDWEREAAHWLARQFVLAHHPLYSKTRQRQDFVIYRDPGSRWWQLKEIKYHKRTI